jgi:hypothetical protein
MKNITDAPNGFFDILIATKISPDKFDPGKRPFKILPLSGGKIVQHPDPVSFGKKSIDKI